MRTLLVDNHDSFTFNLFHLIARVNGMEPRVVRNDELTFEALAPFDFDNVVISPGPGHPEVAADFGISHELILRAEVPVLGVCLGHQGIASAFGAKVRHAPAVMHGRTSRIRHSGTGLFEDIAQDFRAVRYHSLHVELPLPDALEATAWSDDDVLMALRHRERPLFGVQFHPESILSEHGARLFENFCALTPRRFRPPLRTRPPPTRPRSGLELVHREFPTRAGAEQIFTELVSKHPDAFWLDGAVAFLGGERGPLGMRIEARAGAQTEVHDETGSHTVAESAWEVMRQVLAERRLPSTLPFELNGGFVGYVGYEAKSTLGARTRHVSPLPDFHFVFADRLIALDHQTHRTHVFALCRPGERALGEAWVEATCGALAALGPPQEPLRGSREALVTFRFRRAPSGYLADIDTVLAAIREGETYEVCLTNMLEADVHLAPLDFYRALRAINPAPHSAFLRVGDVGVACSSPEQFLRISAAGSVESRPIKGTRPRGATPSEDFRLRTELAASEKDRSENLMVVDLVRHDLGRVCAVGTVEVPELMKVETFPHVHQLISTVRGQLAPDRDAIDAFRAAFPGGSMTGAPKERTMDLLDRLETGPRGVYSGALGYFACSGAADFNIVIRTAVVEPRRVSIGVGGAIVALSDPQMELEELLVKARPLLRAVCTQLGGEGAADNYRFEDALTPPSAEALSEP